MLHEQFRENADEHYESAKTLAATGRSWGTCYYHIGFCTELMIKAVRAKRDKIIIWPETDKGAKWHDLGFLIRQCGLTACLKLQLDNRKHFRRNWLIVKDWDIGKRYPPYRVTEQDARDMLRASFNPTAGVRVWLIALYDRI